MERRSKLIYSPRFVSIRQTLKDISRKDNHIWSSLTLSSSTYNRTSLANCNVFLFFLARNYRHILAINRKDNHIWNSLTASSLCYNCTPFANSTVLCSFYLELLSYIMAFSDDTTISIRWEGSHTCFRSGNLINVLCAHQHTTPKQAKWPTRHMQGLMYSNYLPRGHQSGFIAMCRNICLKNRPDLLRFLTDSMFSISWTFYPWAHSNSAKCGPAHRNSHDRNWSSLPDLQVVQKRVLFFERAVAATVRPEVDLVVTAEWWRLSISCIQLIYQIMYSVVYYTYLSLHFETKACKVPSIPTTMLHVAPSSRFIFTLIYIVRSRNFRFNKSQTFSYAFILLYPVTNTFLFSLDN